MKFIVFEGLDGAGKSTLIEGLKKAIEDQKQSVVLTREPGGTDLGEEIRQLLLRINGEAPTERAELLLYEAARAQHVDKLIRPALQRGDWVISDRFSASTLAFQCGGRSLSRGEVEWLNRYAQDGCEPDLWVLLDLSTEEAKRRMMGRDLDRFERENQDFHERVRQVYLDVAREQSQKWLVLDASLDRKTLMTQLYQYLREKKWL